MTFSRRVSSYSLSSSSSHCWIGSFRPKSLNRAASRPEMSHCSGMDCGGMWASMVPLSTSSRNSAMVSPMSSAASRLLRMW
ncbi:hypothetical protein D9M71_843120 [compost metagenome]